MNKEDFERYIKLIYSYFSKVDRFKNAMAIAFDGVFAYNLDDGIVDGLIDLLEMAMNDTNHLISHFIFEDEFGKYSINNLNRRIEIPINQLWEALQKNRPA
jgi:hypothetical protein